jgi:glutathione S-transferase
MLEELGEPYETAFGRVRALMKAPEYRAINPNGQGPRWSMTATS